MTQDSALSFELEALVRLASARDALERGLLGDPDWLRPDVMYQTARLVQAGGRFLDLALAVAA